MSSSAMASSAMAYSLGYSPFYPLHRIMVVLRHLRHSTWLNHLHCHHPHPQCRHRVNRLFRHIDQLQHYIRRHRLLPTMVTHRPHRQHQQHNEDVLHSYDQRMELRRIHQHQLRESLTRIRQCIRPLRQYLFFNQPNQLTSYQQSMNILNIFTSNL